MPRAAVHAAICLASLLLAGCATVPREDAATTTNLWQRGLAEWHQTPAHVRVRDPLQRVEGVAPPGDPSFAQFDQSMTAFMAQYAVPAGQLALMRDGALLYHAAYGYTQQDGTGTADTNTMFRLASVTKPMTHALVALQVEEGLYRWSDPVFCLPPHAATDCRLPLGPHPNHPVVDDRLGAITVRDLVEHTAGWGRTTDYLYRAEGALKMQEALGLSGPPAAWQAAQYLMGTKLTDDPGTTYAYCNACYMLAGLVAEAATGASLDALYDAYLFRPLGISGDAELGRALPADRNPREPWYKASTEGASFYEPNQTVSGADGGFSMEIVSSAGGLIATSAAVAAVYEAYSEYVPAGGLSVSGQNPYGDAYDLRVKHGLLDGTSTVAGWASDRAGAASVVEYVILFGSDFPATECAGLDQDGVVDATVCPFTWFEQEIFNLAVARAVQPA